MNGIEKNTWLEFFSDKKVGGLLYDYHKSLFDVVTDQPAKCEKRFVTRYQALILVAILAGFFVGIDYKAGWVILGKLFM